MGPQAVIVRMIGELIKRTGREDGERGERYAGRTVGIVRIDGLGTDGDAYCYSSWEKRKKVSQVRLPFPSREG